MKTNFKDWLFRFVKGMFIGSGFVLPGVSGGALAAVFGVYERIIGFLANIRDNFVENVKFFIPIGLGAITGIVLLSFGVSYLLGNYETIILWFFVGCIIGVFPSLWKEAGKEGRKSRDIYIMIGSFIIGLLFLLFAQSLFTGSVAQNFGTWMIAGALIGLGLIVPGLSPSNFLVYMGLYKAMTDGFKSLDFSVIIPIGIGGLLCLILLSKLVNHIFKKAYPQLFHFILGIVMASTIMIIPTNYAGFNFIDIVLCVGLVFAGIALGLWMSKLEEKYK